LSSCVFFSGPRGLSPLENTECYFSTKNYSSNIVNDKDLHHGVTDPRYNLEAIGGGELDKSYQAVFKLAVLKAEEHKRNYDYTVGDFFEEIRGHSQDIPLLDQVRDQLFLPRIAAMYFTDDNGPESLPLVSPMNYFNTQESRDDQQPKRRYFIGGSQTWIEALAENLQQVSSDPHFVSIEIHKNCEVSAKLESDKFIITFVNDTRSMSYDYGIVATHADHANRLLTFGDEQKSAKQTLQGIFKSIRYTESFGVCHTYAGVMPADRNLWRSYNIDIRSGARKKPYNMSYLVNRHQNDSQQTDGNPKFNTAGLPQYFVSLTEDLDSIPDESILDIKAKHALELSTTLSEAVPARVLEKSSDERGGYRHNLSTEFEQRYQNKAVTLFRHNVLNKACLQAQDQLKNYHASAAQRLYITGGWTQGAGLHEECWQQAESIAKEIRSKHPSLHAPCATGAD